MFSIRWGLQAALTAALLSACGGDEGGDGTGTGGTGGGGGNVGGTPGGTIPDSGIEPDVGEVPDAAPLLPPCSDTRDNDGDGLIDDADPGCENPADRDETDPAAPAACSNSNDDDQDGYTDFPADPGCGSEFDDNEANPAIDPLCNDGIDNDRDGLVDEQDPGCTSVADPQEQDPAERPACANGLDDDNDGVVDFPAEPGCRTAGDTEEDDPPQPPDCANGNDDDEDGLVDYPDDPGCAGGGDTDETDKPVRPACADGVDNDRDGKTDYPDDDGCVAAADYSERGSCGNTYDPASILRDVPFLTDISGGLFESEGSCGGRGSPEVVLQYRLERRVERLVISTVGEATQIPTTLHVRRGSCLDEDTEVGCQRENENAETFGNTLEIAEPEPGDYYIFVDGVAGAGGPVQVTVSELDLAQCLNGIDDDGNGRVDFPSDPGCSEPQDRDETPPDVIPACANDEDDDGDGAVDYPLDFGCISAAGNDETDRCGQGVRYQEFPNDREFVLGDTSDGTNSLRGSCGGANTPEVIYRYINPFASRLTFSTNHPETEVSTVLYVRRACDGANTELAAPAGCSTGDGVAMRGRLTIDRAAVGEYWVVVDTRQGEGGPFKLSVEVRRLDPGCVNGRDDDEDGAIDGDDPGCEGPADEDEADPPRGAPLAACNNGDDDDEDGLPDFPYDPGCAARGDADEADGEVLAACANGLDDDDDNRIDFPVDPGCQSRGDDNERNPVPLPQCGDSIDNDDDGVTDYPNDPGCFAAGDPSEDDPAIDPVCANGVDDDRDGVADFPFDPGCIASSWIDESDPDVPPVCSNGMDDDEDGFPDFPRDYGCTYAADPSEVGAAFAPQCGNRRDDDNDARIDFPDDPGCRFAADNDEVNPGQLPPRCNDGVDNDFDGSLDFRDLGCLDAEDDDETDPAEVPLCGNEVDDDADGFLDWPLDPGCQARGDLTEDQGCRPDVDTPLIVAGETVLGATVADGADNYFNRCGGRRAPDAAYRYVVEEAGDVTFSVANPGTDFPAVLSVRSDCEEPSTLIDCAGNFARPEPTVTLRNAEPGEYFVFVDGGGPERIVSRQAPVPMPIDPRGFVPDQGIQDGCGWGDAGNDAFDCFGGSITMNFGGAAAMISPALGTRAVNAGAYRANFTSEFGGQVWRLRFDPAEEFDERPVTITLGGNLGSDGGTQGAVSPIDFEGYGLNYMRTTDGGQFDPPVVHLVVPSDPQEQGAVNYGRVGDQVTITVTNVKLPVVMYFAPSYADEAGVVNALLRDLELQAGPAGPDAPRFGNYELTVQAN